jgi:hypothetical protein
MINTELYAFDWEQIAPVRLYAKKAWIEHKDDGTIMAVAEWPDGWKHGVLFENAEHMKEYWPHVYDDVRDIRWHRLEQCAANGETK